MAFVMCWWSSDVFLSSRFPSRHSMKRQQNSCLRITTSTFGVQRCSQEFMQSPAEACCRMKLAAQRVPVAPQKIQLRRRQKTRRKWTRRRAYVGCKWIEQIVFLTARTLLFVGVHECSKNNSCMFHENTAFTITLSIS